MTTLAADKVNGSDLDVLDRARTELPVGSELASALNDLTSAIRQGVDVVVLRADDELTPTQAAEILKMSRPHLYKILDAGVLPSHRIGRDRRIRTSDVVEFLERREIARSKLAHSFGHVDETHRRVTAKLADVDPETARRLGF